MSITDQVRILAHRHGVIGRRDLRDAELPEEYLARMATRGELVELAPGVYMAPDYESSEHLELAVVAKRVPHAVVFGPSALQFHQVGTQAARAVHIAIERGTWEPQLEWPRIEVVHISVSQFDSGIEVHEVDGTRVQIYSVARSVADMFKFRNRFGLEAAIEALRDGWRDGRFTMDELYA